MRKCPQPLLRLSLCAFALLLRTGGRADVLLQGFYWDVPSPAAGTANADWWWDKLAREAHALRKAGFTAVWIPPVLKGNSGGFSVGYDPFDDYDLGSKDQKGTRPTRYGTREQLGRCVAMLRANGLNVYVDLVLNHRNGDGGDFVFRYRDTFGNPTGGRFEKGPKDFHPNVPQDPNVFDGDHETGFGPDLAPINGEGRRVYDGLMQAGEWLTRALDVQGYRLDYVKGLSTDWLLPFLNFGSLQGKFAVAEFFDYNLGKVADWTENRMQNRCSALDFPLRGLLRDMCNRQGSFDMRSLDHAGMAGRNPFRAVTWVENHDTDRHDPVTTNKLLAYAYILTSEGYPCVYYRDYSTDPGCFGLKSPLDNLVWIHEKIAQGTTRERWKDDDVFAYERLGGQRLLVGLNDRLDTARTVTVDTGFASNTTLHDYTGHSSDVRTDSGGRATITIPANNGGQGYVCYSVGGIEGPLPVEEKSVTQEYLATSDLDIRPAENGSPVQVCRVYVAAGKPIRTVLTWTKNGWTPATRLRLDVLGPEGASLVTRTFVRQTPQGASLDAAARKTGWHTFRVRATNVPASNPRVHYRLHVTYTAPQTL